ncbi:unnamed protein product [Schistosoma curassoni]|uniref:Uncharacterized protein n=1 Tax=Schistosoma curassoni TaxID=6186 RepID=A0A183KV80_9TREM|nr:unnamed protein product [Schistosoma curassoni]
MNMPCVQSMYYISINCGNMFIIYPECSLKRELYKYK